MPRRPNKQPEETFDLVVALGSEPGASSQRFTIYIPDKNRAGVEIGNQRKWVLEAIELLTEINGGATAMPPVEGAWRNDDGVVIWEHPVLVYSFVKPEVFLSAIPRIREFLHRLGRETQQGEVACEFAETFYRIRRYDIERGRPS